METEFDLMLESVVDLSMESDEWEIMSEECSILLLEGDLNNPQHIFVSLRNIEYGSEQHHARCIE
jgi:hypothetical protein